MPVYAISTSTQSGLAVALGHFGRGISGFYLALIEWNTRRETRKALLGLTDRELDDIGLDRADITLRF